MNVKMSCAVVAMSLLGCGAANHSTKLNDYEMIAARSSPCNSKDECEGLQRSVDQLAAECEEMRKSDVWKKSGCDEEKALVGRVRKIAYEQQRGGRMTACVKNRPGSDCVALYADARSYNDEDTALHACLVSCDRDHEPICCSYTRSIRQERTATREANDCLSGCEVLLQSCVVNENCTTRACAERCKAKEYDACAQSCR